MASQVFLFLLGRPSLSVRLLELPNYGLWQAKWFLFCCQTRGCGKPSPSFSTGPKLPDAPFETLQTLQTPRNMPNRGSWSCHTIGAVASQVFLSGSWNCQTTGSGKLSGPFSAAKLAAVASQVFLSGSSNCQTTGSGQAKWSFFCCQTKGCGKPSLSSSTGPKLPDAPFKRFKPSKPFETCQTAALGAAKLAAVASQVFLSGSWNCQTTGSGKLSGPFSAAKLGAVASQVFLFLLARNCRMLPSNASNPPNLSKRAKPRLLELPTRGCGKPSLSCRLLELPNYGLKMRKTCKLTYPLEIRIKMGVGGIRALAPSIIFTVSTLDPTGHRLNRSKD